MRFGIALPQYGYSLGDSSIDWERVRDWALRAERLGFDSAWLSDHLFLDLSKYGGSDVPQPTMEAFTTLAALAAETSTIRIGCMVACSDLRSPTLVAKMATTIDLISRSRFEIGLGAGWYEREFAAAGISFDPPGERVARLEETVQIVKGLISRSPFHLKGKHLRIEDAWNTPVPSRPTPVWVGGKGDRVVRVAARHADGFNSVWAYTPEDYAKRLAVLDQEMDRIGRPTDEVTRSVGLYTVPGSSEKDALLRWERYMQAAPEGTGGIDFESWRMDKLSGDADRMQERIQAFADLGAQEVILGFGTLPFQIADADGVDLFAEEVLPRFKLIRRSK
ncbi:MAG: LLM class flavin-dependent oxidoreductase [Actinomycetota bacterium]|nr:LLM class flavin-dependent oxidoreductase [Actinomycetota bacterium]